MVRPNNYGFSLSLLLHLLILFIPVSMVITKHFKEVELLVMDERPVMPVKEKVIQRPKEMPKEIVKELPFQSVMPESEVNETVVSNTVEPSVVVEKKEAAIARTVVPVVTNVAKEEPRSLKDVEFGSANAPRFIHREMPVYPLIARRLGKEGKVLLRLTIDDKGNLLNVEVIEGAGYGFTEAAVEAVKRSTFQPAVQDGKPVMSKALLPIRFSLKMRD